MGSILAGAIMASARVTLRDPLPGITWTDTDLLNFLNEGQRNACLLRPEACTRSGTIPLAIGTRQFLPEGGTALLRIDSNKPGTGGRCRLVDAALLDAASAVWGETTPVQDVQEYCTDVADPKRFHVYPPNDGSGLVEALYCAVPATITGVQDTIGLDDIYELALKHFVLCEAYAFQCPRQDMQTSGYFRQNFERMLGVGAKTMGGILPKYGATPGGA